MNQARWWSIMALFAFTTQIWAISPTPVPEPEPEPDPTPEQTISDGRYVISSRHNGQALSVASGSLENGADVVVSSYQNDLHQQWDVRSLGNGYYTIRPAHSQKSLDVYEWVSEDGADARQWEFLDGDNQKWLITNQGNGFFEIESLFSGKTLELDDPGAGEGGNVGLWSAWGGDTQQWAFMQVEVTNPEPKPDEPESNDPGTASRPFITSSQAENYTVRKYLARAGNLSSGLSTDNWNPTAGIGALSNNPSYTVGSGGTHSTLQSAISAAVSRGGSTNINIRVLPGTYREVLCVPSNAPPITLYSMNSDASKTVIVYNNYSGKSKSAYSAANACNGNIGSSTYGTTGSASVTIASNRFRAKNLTISNDANEANVGSGTQAVAVLTQGDKIEFENMRFLGNQDTFYAKTGNDDLVKRVYVKDSYIEGDVDFIFGSSTMVFDHCTVHYLTSRQGSNGGILFAPSTDARNPYGILVINSRFTAQGGSPSNYIHLGRAWDAGFSSLGSYSSAVNSGVYPNGQILIRNTDIGGHIRSNDPWRSSTAGRPYSSSNGNYPANRFREYVNTGPGS